MTTYEDDAGSDEVALTFIDIFSSAEVMDIRFGAGEMMSI